MSSCLSTLSATLTPVAECSRNQERKKKRKNVCSYKVFEWFCTCVYQRYTENDLVINEL